MRDRYGVPLGLALCAIGVLTFWFLSREANSGGGSSKNPDELSGNSSHFPEGRSKSRNSERRPSSENGLPKGKSFKGLSIDEMGGSLSSRIERFRKGDYSSPEFVSQLLDDLDHFEPFGGEVYQGYLVSVFLERIDTENGSDATSFLDLYNELQPNLQDKKWGELSVSESLISRLVTHSYSKKYNLIEKLNSVPSGSTNKELMKEVLARSVVYFQDSHEEHLSKLPPEERVKVDQDILKLSALTGNYTMPSISMYLDGLGEEGRHPDLVKKWLSNDKDFISNSRSIEDVVNNAQKGDRRDTLIAEMVKAINNLGQKEAALEWIKEIDNSEIGEEALSSIGER